MSEVVELFRGADGLAGAAARSRLTALAPSLSIAGVAAIAPAALHESRGSAASLASEGFVALPAVATPATCTRMIAAVDALVAAGLPAMFLYLFDEPWSLGLGIAERVSDLLEQPYDLLDDTWAWRIEPGKGKGWPPHRGVSEPLLARDRPELVNVWVALSDAGVERSCMHFVPLDDDPSYPNALSTVTAPLQVVRAAPLAAGSALAWNANILHWGGACSARAVGPRVSCSFSLGRRDALERLDFREGRSAATDLRARLDSVARQIEVYGAGQPDVSREVLEWARAARALEAHTSRLRKAP